MYARIHKSTGAPPDGAREAHTYRRLAADDELMVSLFDTREDAAADPTAEWYEVESDHPGAGSPAGVAAFLYFDGPISDEVHQAAERAHRERIAPAMRTQPGVSRALVLWQPQRRTALVVSTADSVESIEAGQRAVATMELLPGEDAALLPGPDRVELFWAVAS
ncbi:hypothetical protein [Actinokineospora xionganensis]|uniref:Uncharacterized protein n=1 Tax=Actinokineospora xionganensis TaxID=2684470 RepID=A0ABR7LFS1_9PSEU|nr:hypothetical protein [Actinokineospora xionganensis]MBC6451443.1 hypothetical protein [Actinokineospora xionganensis]